MIEQYFPRFGWGGLDECRIHRGPTHRSVEPCRYFIAIPIYDEPDVTGVLKSLTDCSAPSARFRIIATVNHPAGVNDNVRIRSQVAIDSLLEFQHSKILPDWLDLVVVEALDLPPRKAGVGLARKIGMDLCLREIETAFSECVLVALDADCRVSPEYLKSLEEHFEFHPEWSSCSIYYEHPLDRCEDEHTRDAISQYETHLRLYTDLVRLTGLPYGYHTVGSSMAVRADTYIRLGGMNTRKAGEDFYFLEKFMKTGNHSRLQTTAVYPSHRISHRVPFGTGRAMSEMLDPKENGPTESTNRERKMWMTYPLEIFDYLKDFTEDWDQAYHQDLDQYFQETRIAKPLAEYLHQSGDHKAIRTIRGRSTSLKVFRKNMSHHFDAFWIMKWANDSVQRWTERIPVNDCLIEFRKRLGSMESNDNSNDTRNREMDLSWLRTHDRNLPVQDPTHHSG